MATVRVADPRERFEIGDARALPMTEETFDVVVAGLILNWVPDPETAAAEMARVARREGTVAAYV